MTDKIKTGGPAFPNVPSDIQYETWDEGMTLRDYFAAKALGGILNCNPPHNIDEELIGEFMAEVAKYSYAAADAMIKARGDCA